MVRLSEENCNDCAENPCWLRVRIEGALLIHNRLHYGDHARVVIFDCHRFRERSPHTAAADAASP